MKILILSFYFDPDICAGSFRSSALVSQLLDMVEFDLDLHVITTIPNRSHEYFVEAPEIEKQPRLTINRIKVPKRSNSFNEQIKSFIYFAKEVERITRSEKYDLVFATSSRLMTAVLGTWIAKRKKTKLYLDIRDIFVDTISDALHPILAFFCTPIFSIIEKWSFNRAQQINLVSRGFEPYFAAKYAHASLSWFSNGIDKEFLTTRDEPLHVSPKGKLTILYAGTIGHGQGLHYIIPKLANQMRDKIQFKIFGDGGLKPLLQQKLHELKCCNVQLFPPINRESLIKEYQLADILFLHLNDYDAFKKVLPSKIFEYAAMGKPIWAGVSGYSASFLQSEVPNAVVFPPCDADKAELVFANLRLETKKRHDFINKYSRKNIIKQMAANIMKLAIS